MADIFQEVDEDLRHERLLRLWRRFGSYVIGAALAIVLATAAAVAWKNYRTKQLLAEGEIYAKAASLEAAGRKREAAEAFAAIAAGGGGGYEILARLNHAALLAEQGEAGEAVKAYDALAARAGDPVLRDLAVLAAVSLSLDTADPAELRARLDPVRAAGNPLRHAALELSALLAQRTGDVARAREMLNELAADQAAPSGARGRAKDLLQSLGR